MDLEKLEAAGVVTLAQAIKLADALGVPLVSLAPQPQRPAVRTGG